MKTFNRTGQKIKKVKHFILFTFISIIYSSYAQDATWHLLPFVPSQTLWDIYCVNKDTVVAVGDKGYIIRTIDGGIHWDSIYSTTNNTLYKVTFVNDSIGYICGNNGTILKTINNGLTWTKIGIQTLYDFLSMNFLNQDTGWIVGGNEYFKYGLYENDGILLKTYNQGMNWEIDTSYNFTLSSVFFIDKDTGYVSMNNYPLTSIAKTTDGGKSFQFIVYDSLVNAYTTDICFISPQIGYYISRCEVNDCDRSGIFKTMDYGKTWDKIVKVADIENAYFFDTCILYYTHFEMSGSGSYYYDVCQDYIEEFPYFNGMYLLNENYGFCVGGGEIFGQFRHYIYKKGEIDNIEEIKKSEKFHLIPNPCNGISMFSGNYFNDVLSLNVEIFNILGQKINTQIQINDQEIQIDLSTEKSGVYIVCIKDKNKLIQTCKLIKL